MKQELLQKLEDAIMSPREKGRLKNIREAYKEYAMSLKDYQPWWKKLLRRKQRNDKAI